jgi:hypothetical protein
MCVELLFVNIKIIQLDAIKSGDRLRRIQRRVSPRHLPASVRQWLQYILVSLSDHYYDSLREKMETEQSKSSAVWNADDEMWVILDDGLGMVTAPTILELSQVMEGLKPTFPMRVRYPGRVEMVDCIH